MPGLPSNPRARPARAPRKAALSGAQLGRLLGGLRCGLLWPLLVALLGATLGGGLLGGCFATDPQLYPFDPPPNLPSDLVLLEVSDQAVSSMHSDHVADELGSILLRDALKVGYEPLSDERRQQILAHQVVTGMTVREVQWSLVADPARVRSQGPPGGTTLIFETPGGMYGCFWVRFDDDGKAADAGSY